MVHYENVTIAAHYIEKNNDLISVGQKNQVSKILYFVFSYISLLIKDNSTTVIINFDFFRESFFQVNSFSFRILQSYVYHISFTVICWFSPRKLNYKAKLTSHLVFSVIFFVFQINLTIIYAFSISTTFMLKNQEILSRMIYDGFIIRVQS